ncbi:MAG: hypothetical protein Q9202_002241 [Teloschistes flavicans]
MTLTTHPSSSSSAASSSSESLQLILPDLTTTSLPSPSTTPPSPTTPPQRPTTPPPPPPPPPPPTTLLTLPPELLALIPPLLPYPDALALKHTSRLFYNTIPTSVPLRVAWLLSRHARGLPCPRKKCILLTDEAFCGSGGGQVRDLMQRRRRHEECGWDGKGGCEVVVGEKCAVRLERGKGRGGRGGLTGWGVSGGMSRGIGRARFQGTMGAVDPKLKLLAVLIALFSFLVNVVVGMRLYDCVKSAWA